jgi:hypothetical protein
LNQRKSAFFCVPRDFPFIADKVQSFHAEKIGMKRVSEFTRYEAKYWKYGLERPQGIGVKI